MENLNEGKKKKMSYMAELAEIDKQSAIVAMEAKINKLAEMIEAKNTRLNMVSEDENLSELIDKKRVKDMQREIKILEKEKSKMEKMYEKMGAKKKEMVDEEKKDDEMNEGGYGMPSYEEDDDKPSMEEEIDEAHCNTEEDDINEEVNRWQKLAGIDLNENVGVSAARGLAALSKIFKGKGDKTADEMYREVLVALKDAHDDAKSFMEIDKLLVKLKKYFSYPNVVSQDLTGGRRNFKDDMSQVYKDYSDDPEGAERDMDKANERDLAFRKAMKDEYIPNKKIKSRSGRYV